MSLNDDTPTSLRRVASPTRWLRVSARRAGWRRARAAAAMVSLTGILLAGAPSPAVADAPTPRLLDEYVLTSWADQDGLFGGWIVGIAQDAHGYLWIGTVSGVIRFDGSRFERFRGTTSTPLPQRSVSTVVSSRDGSIWVGFARGGGIYRIHDGQVQNYGTADESGRITALIEDADGVLLVGMSDGLYRLARDRWARVSAGEGLPGGAIHGLFRDRAGAVWASTSTAIYRRAPQGRTFERQLDSDMAPRDFAELADGSMWMTDRDVGYTEVQSRQGAHAAAPRGAGYRLLDDRFGNLWVATLGQGLWFLRGGRGEPQVMGNSNGLSNDTVRCLFEDRNGDVWVGTTVGLHRFSRRRVTSLTDLGSVRAVEATPDGSVWVGTANGVVRIVDGAQRWYRAADGLPSDEVRALHVDATGTLWVATDAGVAVFRGQRFAPLPADGPGWASDIIAIATDAVGGLWICAQDSGLLRWRDGHVTRIQTGAPASVYSIAAGTASSTWLVLDGGGLGLLSPGGTFDLRRNTDQFHQSDVAHHRDDTGAVWFGGGNRLSRFQDGRLTSVEGTSGLPAGAIRAIVSDRDGYLWIGTSGGISRIARSEFDKALERPAHHLEFRSYNFSDGLAGVPVRIGSPAAVRAADGRLWFVSGNGLTVLDPRRLAATRPAPAVHVERVTANGRTFAPEGLFRLPPRTTSLEIEYTALEYFSPRQVEFHYRLEGLDDGWTEAGSRRQASFTNLPPRRYRFHVIARSSEGVWNEQGDAIEFLIEPMFYQTRWFAASCGVAGLAVIFAGWRLRLRQVRRKFASVLAERARMAREIHDTLLQSLAGLELQVDAMSTALDGSHDAVRQQLQRVRRQIQADVCEARQSIWDLRSPSLESRDLPTALEELGEALSGSRGIRFEFALTGTPTRCAHKVEEHLLRVGREALSNATRHAGASLVRLELHYGARVITLRVSDDGRGFNVADAIRQTECHWGLTTMHERAQAIGGRLDIVSRPGAGTNLEMVAPLLSSSPS